LDARTESSGKARSFQTALTRGSPGTPNWTMKFGTTREKRESSKKPARARL